MVVVAEAEPLLEVCKSGWNCTDKFWGRRAIEPVYTCVKLKEVATLVLL